METEPVYTTLCDLKLTDQIDKNVQEYASV